MSHDPIRCGDCGESYDPGGSPHDCPGSPRDLAERIDELENELHELERDHAALLRALIAFCESDPRTLRNMLEQLMKGRA